MITYRLYQENVSYLLSLFQERSSGVVIVESSLCFRVVHTENFRKYTFIAENAIAVVTGAVELFESEYTR